MPKGSIRNPGTKKPLVSAKTWAGQQLPLRTKAELRARFKNMSREAYSETADRERATARGVRADPGTGPIPRVTRNPVKSLKQRAAQKPAKKK
jgi:hypothetical protein